MSQQMNILHCSSCKTYQVHIVKKAKKWQCKMCNFKQTFKQAYFQGSGKDCRLLVQKLNLSKEHEVQENVSFDICSNMSDNYLNAYPEQSKISVCENKWAKYLDTSDEIESNTYKALNNESTNSDTMNFDDSDNALSEYSQNNHTNIDNDSSYENNAIIEKKYDNVVSEEISDNILYNDDNSKNNDFHNKSITEAKYIKNIFDDNEELDLTIDF